MFGFKRTGQPEKRGSASDLSKNAASVSFPPAAQCEHHGFLTKKAKAKTGENKRYFVYNHNVAPACTCRSTFIASRPVL